MRNPNGYGSVVKLSGNRRKPFMARITTGYRDNGQPIYTALDYFARREDALICLAQYNDAQFSVDYRNLTLAQLYDKLRELEFPQYSQSLQGSLAAAYNYLAALYNVRYRTIRKHQMQTCIDTCGKSQSTQTNIRNLFWHLDRLAFDLDIISKRYSETLTVRATATKDRQIFTDAEVKLLWQHRPASDPFLVMLYTGLRMSELLTVVQDGDCLRGGVKTAAGKNRVIPIHPAIEGMFREFFPGPTIGARKRSFTRAWDALMQELGMTHTSHDCRHTFRSKLDSAGANKVCIDLIMGHKSPDIGERVYTHKTLEELRETVALVTY